MTADFSKPTAATTYGTYSDYITDMFEALAKMAPNEALNIPDGAVRWNATSKRFEIYSAISTSWGALTDYFDIEVTSVNGLSATTGEINKVCDGTGSYGYEIDYAADGIGVSIPRQKIIEIGVWNMDTTMTVNVAHGLSVSKIIGVRALVRTDTGNTSHPLIPGGASNAPGVFEGIGAGSIGGIDSTYVTLHRESSGAFDYSAFNATGYNRGWIIIDYLT